MSFLTDIATCLIGQGIMTVVKSFLTRISDDVSKARSVEDSLTHTATAPISDPYSTISVASPWSEMVENDTARHVNICISRFTKQNSNYTLTTILPCLRF